jgi:RNA polymerase sigma-70 factor (ECF subfamily)
VDVVRRDRDLLRSISEGSESAFVGLMDRPEPGLLRLARSLIPADATAHDLQALLEQTWLLLLSELGRFDGNAPLKAWLHGKLLQVIRSRFSEVALELDRDASAPCGAAVAAERFSPPGDRWQGHWRSPPQAWSEAQVTALPAAVDASLRALPALQRVIAILHDCEALSTLQISQLLGIDEPKCKRLLHVARSQLWAASERVLAEQRGA